MNSGATESAPEEQKWEYAEDVTFTTASDVDPEPPTALGTLVIPLQDGELNIDFVPGHVTVVVGANGTGKTALAWRTFGANNSISQWILASRDLELAEGGSSFSYAQRETSETQSTARLAQLSSRYRNASRGVAQQIAFFDLINKSNAHERVELRLRRHDATADEIAAHGSSPLATLNGVISRCGLKFQVQVSDKGALECSSGTAKYDISQLSDGERNVVALAAELLVSEKPILLIDEPERHLHRSITSPLLNELADLLVDRHVVMFTHDIDFAASLPADKTAIVSLLDVNWEDSSPVSWHAEHLPTGDTVPEDVRRAVLGGRSKILFCEGTAASADKSLYELLFPDSTVVAMGSCEAVIKAASAYKATPGLHWLDVNGIIDRDSRSDGEVERLQSRGVATLNVPAIESVYFSKAGMKAVAKKCSELFPVNGSDERLANAHTAGLNALTSEALRKIARETTVARLQRTAQHEVNSLNVSEIEQTPVTLTLSSDYKSELSRLETLVSDGNLVDLVATIPIKKTALPGVISAQLGLRDTEQYMQLLRTLLRDDDSLQGTLSQLTNLAP